MNKNQKELEGLKKIVSPSTYLELLVFFAGKTIYFPKGNEMDKGQRNESIRQKFWKEGATIAELVDKYGLSESQIRRIIRK